jgi:hypothetical protein
MLGTVFKSIAALIFLFALSTCIDPYNPELKGYESLLVVEGMVSDEIAAYTVRLSRTIQEQNTSPEKVTDAALYITDNIGNTYYMRNSGNGIYKTDSTEFIGIPGRTYVLHIENSDGRKYESDPCMMQSVPDIDSIYFARDQELVNNATEIQDGIRIFLDSKPGDNNQYYRWDFKETWKFKIPSPTRFDYINVNHIIPVTQVKQYCWKSRKSDVILIRSMYSGQEGRVKREPIFFIASNKSDRLMLEYSINVKQYSISRKEYDFWDNLKRVDESGGDIFATQPFPVISNIHNISDAKEKVLGYFQVSSVKRKMKNILFSDIVDLGLPYFHNSVCERIEKGPKDFPWPENSPPLTFDDIYSMYTSSGYSFIEPMYSMDTNMLEKLVFAKSECADCSLTGTLTKPDFRSGTY